MALSLGLAVGFIFWPRPAHAQTPTPTPDPLAGLGAEWAARHYLHTDSQTKFDHVQNAIQVPPETGVHLDSSVGGRWINGLLAVTDWSGGQSGGTAFFMEAGFLRVAAGSPDAVAHPDCVTVWCIFANTQQGHQLTKRDKVLIQHRFKEGRRPWFRIHVIDPMPRPGQKLWEADWSYNNGWNPILQEDHPILVSTG
jgi:hypothetical protein